VAHIHRHSRAYTKCVRKHFIWVSTNSIFESSGCPVWCTHIHAAAWLVLKAKVPQYSAAIDARSFSGVSFELPTALEARVYAALLC